MANSKYEYVRSFEQPDILLANTWVVVRIDGRGFSKLTTKYKFTKPNDRRGLDLMNAAAEAVMKELPDLVLAYGNSDEFSFVFHKDCALFERRASKLTTTIVSTFTSYYTYLWKTYFPDAPLTPPLPSFDGRAVCYPSDQNLRDYMSWRQVDCHINNLYNTTFWALVQKGGIDARIAEQELSGTVSSDKNEILFSRFGINYNNEPEIFKKGSVLYRDFFPTSTQSSPTPPRKTISPPDLSHPQPRRILPRPMSQPLERTLPDLLRDSPLSTTSTPRGPTFLSTSTTPSPPPSPPTVSMPPLPQPQVSSPATSFPQTFVPVPAPTNGSTPAPSTTKHFPVLTPLPLPPPTLKPPTKPPPSLMPPNLTTHTNTSPMASPNAEVPIPTRTTSHPSKHFASASLPITTSTSATRPLTASASSAKPGLKHRSPSLSALDFRGPPQIPLRISSIPVNNKPRKMSLPSQKSFGMLNKHEEKENFDGGRDRANPVILHSMKELPSPPIIDDQATRNAVMGDGPEKWVTSSMQYEQFATSPVKSREGEAPMMVSPPPERHPARRSRSHSRLHSAPTSSYFPSAPTHQQAHISPEPQQPQYRSLPVQPYASPPRSPPTTTFPKPQPVSQAVPSSPPQRGSSKSSKASKSKPKTRAKEKANITEDGGWAAGTKGNEGRPSPMSKTQREKDRKKRTKASIVIEHVDIIKDEFWERRPWILNGRAG